MISLHKIMISALLLGFFMKSLLCVEMILFFCRQQKDTAQRLSESRTLLRYAIVYGVAWE
ncbi:unnamed protein product [Ceratitis capitata]|uniref:(Mediterranean fruit fly) hypothetical protein n=1 Tax=Ceratitis capitata TaxID=7213 RepID=A0A811UNX1_CERCA|nr:unnamed protein product [Ceratitis capitata]